MRVVWTPAALSDLDEIQDYIAQDSPAAAYWVMLELTTRTRTNLADYPLMGRIGRAAGTRELVFPDLPYIVAYRVTEKVEVLAVVHMAREWPDDFT
ncbi:MAG: type II toxin-antitoxin system RelE/ParE family toxin [Hyphomicrobiales bacterium]|nr:MAG: type II toxin-antitoxin system RelE/ParE family toxin [Hyphomicrobiales bacterium]